MIESAESVEDLNAVWKGFAPAVKADTRVIEAGRDRKAQLTPKPADLGDDLPESMK
jgi:hypothetical protein